MRTPDASQAQKGKVPGLCSRACGGVNMRARVVDRVFLRRNQNHLTGRARKHLVANLLGVPCCSAFIGFSGHTLMESLN